MELRVDDFGCVPDGRVLERVTIAAGSTVLASPDGGLRATDVGKNIAIPGAADLGANLDVTIASLANRTEVKNASMTARSNVLTAIFTTDQEERFRKSLHTGRRIVVLGAGPAGQPLLTDVADVTDQMTLILADAASTTVTGVQATLNRPDFVGLSNYARRSVAGVTVNLGDRVINDAAMTLGSRGLTSPTAKFSRLDLDKRVTIRAAGLFVTTIQSVTSATQASLAVPAQYAVTEQDRGADVWKTDSRPGLELLLASLASQNIESAEICFGPGVYDFTVGAQRAAIGLRNLRNLTLRGAGTGATVIRLMPNQTIKQGADADVIRTFGCRNLTFRNLSVHGSYLTLDNAAEQMHGIHLTEGSEEIAVHRVRVFQCAGDGLRLLGSPARRVRKVWVEGCRFIQNKRSGVSFQRASEFVWIHNCYIETTIPSTDQSLDFEPTGEGAPTDIIIESNIIVHQTGTAAVSISGISSTDATRRVTFAHNIVLGGEIFCTDVTELTIKNNIVLIPASDRPPGVLLNLARGGESVRITENLLISERAGTPAVIHLGASARPVSRALVAGNLCITPGGQGINLSSSSLSSCDDVVIEQNMLVATGPCAEGVQVQSDTSAVNGISVRDNDITVKGPGTWTTGILLSGNKIHHASAVGNSLRGVATGIKFAGNEFTPTPVCALNRTAETVTKPIDLEQLPGRVIVAGGAASQGGPTPGSGSGRFLVGQGNPENNVTGNAGDVYQRVGSGAGPRLFVKESDALSNTGWVAK
jgi:parallel beta helix pectate lyase-like protein